MRHIHVRWVGGNGFPSRCYAPLLRRLRDDHGVHTTAVTDVHTHASPASWAAAIAAVAEDVAADRERLGPDALIVGAGHSLGGALQYAASAQPAAAAPAAVDRLWMFDPPMFRPLARAGMLALQRLGAFDVLPIARFANKKPRQFDTRRDAEQFVRGRRFYQAFAPEMLEAFLADGIVSDGGGGGGGGAARFRFCPEAELNFFRSTPADIPGFAPFVGQYGRSRAASGTYIYSTRHEFAAAADVAYLKRQLQDATGAALRFEALDVGHSFPLEDPAATAAMLRGTIFGTSEQ